MKKCATISADIIASSSLSAQEIERLTSHIHLTFAVIEKYQRDNRPQSVLCRLALGDMIECLVFDPSDALRVALLIKASIMSFPVKTLSEDEQRTFFREYGVRVAIGMGEMELDFVDKGIWKGEAINRSGRLIAGEKTSDKERVTIRRTLFFSSPDERQTATFEALFALLDVMLNKMTSKQAQIVFWKLLDQSEQAIAGQLDLSQSSVNQRSTAAGWAAIEKAVKFFESTSF